jgi:hypothetical protein
VLRLQASEEIKATAGQSSPKSPPLVSKIGHSGSQCRDILSPVKIKQLTKTQLLSVSCPTCGVGVGMHCILYSGGSRSEPHVERRLSALGIAERKAANPHKPEK